MLKKLGFLFVTQFMSLEPSKAITQNGEEWCTFHRQDGSEFSELFYLTYYSLYFWYIAKNIKVGHIMSVPPHIFAPRNLKWSYKDMKQVKYDKVYDITDSLQRV